MGSDLQFRKITQAAVQKMEKQPGDWSRRGEEEVLSITGET